MTTHFDEKTLMAFADGSLDAEAARRVREAVEEDPELASRIDAFTASRYAVKAIYAGLADRPVPSQLAANVQAMIDRSNAAHAAERAPIPFRQRTRRPQASYARLALAACLAAAVAAPLGYLVARGLNVPLAGNETRLAIGSTLPADLAAVLNSVPSGDVIVAEGGGRIRPIASFVDAGGALCREFELDRADTVVAVACRREGDWRLAFAVDAPPVGDGYAPASSIAVLDAYLDAISAGEPLSPEAEALALTEISAS